MVLVPVYHVYPGESTQLTSMCHRQDTAVLSAPRCAARGQDTARPVGKKANPAAEARQWIQEIVTLKESVVCKKSTSLVAAVIE
jgi:hypothetical protein